MLSVAVNPPKCDHGVQGNHGVHADCSLGDASQVCGSTVLLSNPIKKVSIADNASCGRQPRIMESKMIAA